jgi:hypothetical protein
VAVRKRAREGCPDDAGLARKQDRDELRLKRQRTSVVPSRCTERRQSSHAKMGATPRLCRGLFDHHEPSRIVALFRVMNRYVGNLPPMPGVLPDYPAPVVLNAGGEREMVLMRWPPPHTGGPPVTNIRNTSSPH